MAKIDLLKALQQAASKESLLYVEDSTPLRNKAAKVLKHFFRNVYVADDGEAGLELFRRYRPKIVITDIVMPKMDGMEMARRILKEAPDTKILVTSARYEQDFLAKAMDIGIFNYLKKPFSVKLVASLLLKALQAIRRREGHDSVAPMMQEIVNTQSALLLMFDGTIPIFANCAFLGFFGVDSLVEFQRRHRDIGTLFEPHRGFLSGGKWFETASRGPGRLFNVKIKDRNGMGRHFLLKLNAVPGQKGHTLLSLSDVTELGLLELYDRERSRMEAHARMVDLFRTMLENGAPLKILNFYKGLTISNPAILESVEAEEIRIRTNFMQQKAIQYQEKMVISSDLLPKDLICNRIDHIDFGGQTVSFHVAEFCDRSPMERKHVRVVPEEDHTVILYFRGRPCVGRLSILDVSVASVKIAMDALPAGIKTGAPVSVAMAFRTAKDPVAVEGEGKVYRIDHGEERFDVVILLDLDIKYVKPLTNYIAKRQIDLIREFKSMQIEKK